MLGVKKICFLFGVNRMVLYKCVFIIEDWCCVPWYHKVAGEGQIELLSKHHLSRLFATIIMWCVCVLESRILQWKTWWQLSTNWELWRWNTVGLFLDQKGVILFFKRSFLRSFFQVLIWFQKMNQNKWLLGLTDRCELSMKNVTWHFWFLKISPLLNLSVEDVYPSLTRFYCLHSTI